MKIISLELAVVLGALIAGCGEAVSPDYAPAIGTLRGRITGPAVIASHPLRLALVWQRNDGHGNLVVQEMAIESIFPARFKLTVTEPPPEAAMRSVGVQTSDGSASIRTAFGHLAVYEDLNDNGRFDLVLPGSDQAIDRLLSDGDDGRIELRYFEGLEELISRPATTSVNDCASTATECPQPRVISWRRGLNVARVTRWPDTGERCVATPCRLAGPSGDTEILDPAADIELTLDAPAFSKIQCEGWSAVEEPSIGACPNGAAPAGWGIGCFTNGAFFALSPQSPTAPLCHLESHTCDVAAPAGPLPADWPCQ